MGGILGTGLKWLTAAVGLFVWLGLALGGSYLFFLQGLPRMGGDAAAAAIIASAGLIICLVASVVLLRLTGRFVAFLLCVALGGLALGAGIGRLQELSNVEDRFPIEIHAETPAASGGAVVPAPAPAVEEKAAEPKPADDSVAALEQQAARAEEEYLAASQRLARARSGSAGLSSSAQPGPMAEAGTGPGGGLAAPPAPVVAAPAPRAAEKAEVDPTQFKLAELRFNKPTEMELNKSYVVEATVAAPGAAAPQGLGTVGPVVTRQTEITRKVRVELLANDFKVEKLHTVDTVLITDKTPGQWSWRVTPTKEGVDRKMLLQVFGVLEQNGAEQGQVLIKTYEETIPVTVTAMGRVTAVAQTVVSSWELIAGIAGVLGGIWVFLGNIGKALRGKDETIAA
jgi:hypothetical protein